MAITVGTNGNDTIVGGNQGDLITAGAGDDVIIGDGGGGNTGDNILTGIVNDIRIIEGSNGKDTLTGGKEDNLIFGQGNDDVIRGREGDDILSGGAGNDTLTGGKGITAFALALGEGIDTIIDFSGEDRILIEQESFNATSTEQFIYNDATGELFFDPSVAGTAPVQIATLPVELGSTFNAETDIIFDESGLVNSLNSESTSISLDRQTFIDDFFAELEI